MKKILSLITVFTTISVAAAAEEAQQPSTASGSAVVVTAEDLSFEAQTLMSTMGGVDKVVELLSSEEGRVALETSAALVCLDDDNTPGEVIEELRTKLVAAQK